MITVRFSLFLLLFEPQIWVFPYVFVAQVIVDARVGNVRVDRIIDATLRYFGDVIQIKIQ